MASMQDLQTAIAAAPAEMTVEAALRVADGYRARLERLQEQYRGLLLTLQPNITKAAVLDHVLSAEDSTLVLCEASYRDGRWSFSPLSSIEDARRVMDGDLARAEEESRESGPGNCHCGGTPACNVCGGQG